MGHSAEQEADKVQRSTGVVFLTSYSSGSF